ncbi:LemA family protein [Clostridium estertheticum]|uniref:LemA family protein n=2 Tax=Clostridium estertheticum TaxID=238834 RepID=UPI001C6E5865|nr:LemA family protein [Clostridium estertheticum]MBW9151268.1 LemA family protein [Clostridium estertheticum]
MGVTEIVLAAAVSVVEIALVVEIQVAAELQTRIFYKKGDRKMTKANKKFVTILAVVVLVVGFLIVSYNGMVTQRVNVTTQQSNIDTVLQRRADLIPNIVNTVKAYAKHETDIFTGIASSRAKMMGAGTTKDKLAADTQLTAGLGKLMAVAEAYPNLKADTQFTALTTELEGSENRVAVARKNYNDAVGTYNTKISTFPKNIMASLFGFKQAEFFKAAASSNIVPKVTF